VIEADNFFTSYGPLPLDTLHQKERKDSLIQGNATGAGDSISDLTEIGNNQQNRVYGESRSIDSIKNDDGKRNSPMNFLKVHTDYSEALGSSSRAILNALDSTAQDLFLELILPTDKDKKQAEKLLGHNQLSYTTVLKMLSVVASDILVHGEHMYNQQLLSIISEDAHISDLFIVNRDGVIVKSTHTTWVNKPILSFINTYDVNSTVMKNIEIGDRSYLSLPLYHTYGLVGQAVLVLDIKKRQ
jgi:hypothetical protein